MRRWQRPSAPAPGGGGPPQTGDVATLTLTSAVGGSLLPFTVGHTFKQGAVSSASVAALGADTAIQVTPKNYYADGSLKMAVVSGRKTLSAGTPATVAISNSGTVASGSNLTTTDLKNTSVTASIAYASYGTVSWATTDWDSPAQTLTTGPVMSSWTYRKPIGSDAHLVGWLEVRLYVDGRVQVLAWLENGYLRVASPGARTGTVTFTLGGTSRYSANLDLLHHQRAALGSGTTLFHWYNGSDPQITPKHDRAYMQSTDLVPSYGAVASSTRVAALTQSYTPLAVGDFDPDMPSPSYHEDIGLLPQHDAIYLTSDDSRGWLGVLINGMAAGRYGIHYRDEATNRPLRFSQQPNLVTSGNGIQQPGASSTNDYTPTTSGGTPPIWDVPHHPSIGYMAYLISGWNYYLEELQFAATCNYICNTDLGGSWNQRGGSAGVFLSNAGANDTRGAGWAIRTLAQACTATPDADTTLRNEFLSSMGSNIDLYYTKYVAQANSPMGVVAPATTDYGAGGDGKFLGSVFMNYFFVASIGYTLALRPAVTTTQIERLEDFFAWNAQFAIGMFGGTASDEYNWRYAANYTVATAPADSIDFLTGTGPWYTNWGEVFTATHGFANPGAGDGAMQGGNFPDPTSYWGNLQPAIAYAVRHGVPGAVTARNRMLGATNWSTFAAALADAPEWAVVPNASRWKPAWFTAAAAGELISARNINDDAASIAPPSPPPPGNRYAVTDAWGCMTIRQSGGQIIYQGEGHSDGWDNGVVGQDIFKATPTSHRWRNPSTNAVMGSGGVFVYSDGNTATDHSYNNLSFSTYRGSLIRLYAGDVPLSGNSSVTISWPWKATNWNPAGTHPNVPYGATAPGVAVDQYNQIFLWRNQDGAQYRPAKNDWITRNEINIDRLEQAAVFDFKRRVIWSFGGYNSSSGTVAKWDIASSTTSTVSVTGNATGDTFTVTHGLGASYDEVGDKIYIHSETGAVAVFDPVALTINSVSLTGATMNANSTYRSGGNDKTWGKAKYHNLLDAMIYKPGYNSPLFVHKLRAT
jgi:hypothetical protein